MAESESTPRQTGASSTSPPARQGTRGAGEARLQGQELTTQGKAIAAEVAAQGQKYVRTWQTQLEQQVRERPLQALLMAAGIGLLLGLLRRR